MASSCNVLHIKTYSHKEDESSFTNILASEIGLNVEGKSNLEFFLDHITPSVQCLPKAMYEDEALYGKWKQLGADEEGKPIFFSLGDLWASFDEWSVYGAGVPLILPCGETIMQYYVPYLSALQIYLTNKRPPYHEESDWSDVSDLRSVGSSDFGSDNENEKMQLKFQMKAVTEQYWDNLSCVSSDRLSFSMSSDESECRQGDLVFEYFERCSPYGRTPLAGKIRELAVDFPQLYTLKSNELSPASWVSVAWYPIYRIPTGPTMSDLPTCFLTFHSLWMPPLLQDAQVDFRSSPALMLDDNCYRNTCWMGSDHMLVSDNSSNNLKQEQEKWLHAHSAWRVKPGMVVELPAFGLASYKLRGPFWASAKAADKERVTSLVNSADSWIRQLKVRHPDFDFFVSREGITT